MITAAGIMFLTADKKVLFVRRGNGADHPNEWCFPGGKQEDGETIEQCAIRETKEEAGVEMSEDRLEFHTRAVVPVNSPVQPIAILPEPGAVPVEPAEGDAADFTTFLARVDEPFLAVINPDEHTGWAWADVHNPPLPLHPGAAVALERLSMDELGVAKAIAENRLVSPQAYANMTLFAIRITGTGVAFRSSIGEFVYRDPSLYLNDEFLARCNGLSVILEHPDKAVLDSKEFVDRVIGSVMFAYIRGDEVWAIAKIYDADAIKLMRTVKTSTSPAVVFQDPSVNNTMTLEDGSPLLIEGRPSLLDHIAVLPEGAGVWDKGGELAGVDQTGTDVRADAFGTGGPPRLDPAKLRRLDRGVTLLNVRLSNLAAQRRFK